MTNPQDGEERSEGPRNRRAAAYQGAFEAVMAILIAVFLGDLADDHFGTAPRYLLVGFVIGFCSFVLRLVRLGRALQDTPPKDRLDDQ
jgi:F0F1-type ATP synthase assembly protein I